MFNRLHTTLKNTSFHDALRVLLPTAAALSLSLFAGTGTALADGDLNETQPIVVALDQYPNEDQKKDLIRAASYYKTSPEYLLAWAHVVSEFNPYSKGEHGERGLLHIHPRLAEDRFGINAEMLWDDQISAEIGAQILSETVAEQSTARRSQDCRYYTGSRFQSCVDQMSTALFMIQQINGETGSALSHTEIVDMMDEVALVFEYYLADPETQHMINSVASNDYLMGGVSAKQRTRQTTQPVRNRSIEDDSDVLVQRSVTTLETPSTFAPRVTEKTYPQRRATQTNYRSHRTLPGENWTTPSAFYPTGYSQQQLDLKERFEASLKARADRRAVLARDVWGDD